MNAVRIHRQIHSDTPPLPEGKPFLGKRVEIIVLEDPAVDEAIANRWEPLVQAAGQDLVDPKVYQQYRAFDRLHSPPSEPGL